MLRTTVRPTRQPGIPLDLPRPRRAKRRVRQRAARKRPARPTRSPAKRVPPDPIAGILQAARAMSGSETEIGGDLAGQIEKTLRAAHRKFRREVRQIMREARPRRFGDSPLDRERARLDDDLCEARLTEDDAAEDLAEAGSVLERARAALLRAVERNRYGPEVLPLEAKLRQAEGGLQTAHRQLAACRQRRQHHEGEALNLASASR